MRNRFSPRRQDRKAFTGTVFPFEKRLRDMVVDEELENLEDDIYVSPMQDEYCS